MSLFLLLNRNQTASRKIVHPHGPAQSVHRSLGVAGSSKPPRLQKPSCSLGSDVALGSSQAPEASWCGGLGHSQCLPRVTVEPAQLCLPRHRSSQHQASRTQSCGTAMAVRDIRPQPQDGTHPAGQAEEQLTQPKPQGAGLTGEEIVKSSGPPPRWASGMQLQCMFRSILF